MNLGFEHQSFRIHEQVALPTLHLFGTVVAALFSAYTGSLDRLAIYDARARLGIPAETDLTRSRSAACILSQVPSKRNSLK